jgi:hypothetical protein
MGFTHLLIERNPWLGGYHPQTSFSLPPVLNWICLTPLPKKNPGYATVFDLLETCIGRGVGIRFARKNCLNTCTFWGAPLRCEPLKCESQSNIPYFVVLIVGISEDNHVKMYLNVLCHDIVSFSPFMCVAHKGKVHLRTGHKGLEGD